MIRTARKGTGEATRRKTKKKTRSTFVRGGTKKATKKKTAKAKVSTNGKVKKEKALTKKESTARQILGMKREKIINPNANSWGHIVIKIEGDSGFMPKQFSKKVQDELDEKAQGAPKKKRGPKDIVADCIDCFHVIGRRPTSMSKTELKKTQFGFPVTAFKHAMEKAAVGCGWKSTEFRQCVRLEADDGYMVKLKTSIPRMDVRPVRLNGPRGKVPDIRHRPFFEKWSTTLRIQYNARLVTAQQVVVFCDDAGSTGGIGELRPGKSSAGMMGTWKIVSAVGDVPKFA